MDFVEGESLASTITREGSLPESVVVNWATQLLDALTDRGVKLAVLSNKAHNFTELMVSRMLARWHFDEVVGASASVPRKPDPTVALQIAQRLKFPPAAFIYLGDSDIDMMTAVAAGMYPVGARWGFRSAGELLASGAKMVINQPCDLLRLL
jgi:phosphoglycolate phosphatase